MQAFITNTPEETFELGRRIGASLSGGEIILLDGDLGAGKTLLTKGIATALDCADTVVSPSFTLLNLYKARLDIIHVDLYRLEADEIWGLGIEDYMDQEHIVIVEWADIARSFFRGCIIEARIEYLDANSRRITLAGTNLEDG